jgi:hypothetical protein
MRNFKSALRKGQDAERRWVEAIREGGRSVAHGKKITVRKHCKRTGHVETPDAVALLAIEIKERSLSFTSPEDYPYETVFVDDLRGMGMETTQNFAYVYLSKPTGQWVWLTPLDRDESWTEEVVWDRGRNHEVPTLVAPKSCLRPAETLLSLIYPQDMLELVDGDCGLFVSGGGEVEERDRYVAKTHPDAPGRERTPAPKARKHLG